MRMVHLRLHIVAKGAMGRRPKRGHEKCLNRDTAGTAESFLPNRAIYRIGLGRRPKRETGETPKSGWAAFPPLGGKMRLLLNCADFA